MRSQRRLRQGYFGATRMIAELHRPLEVLRTDARAVLMQHRHLGLTHEVKSCRGAPISSFRC